MAMHVGNDVERLRLAVKEWVTDKPPPHLQAVLSDGDDSSSDNDAEGGRDVPDATMQARALQVIQQIRDQCLKDYSKRRQEYKLMRHPTPPPPRITRLHTPHKRRRGGAGARVASANANSTTAATPQPDTAAAAADGGNPPMTPQVPAAAATAGGGGGGGVPPADGGGGGAPAGASPPSSGVARHSRGGVSKGKGPVGKGGKKGGGAGGSTASEVRGRSGQTLWLHHNERHSAVIPKVMLRKEIFVTEERIVHFRCGGGVYGDRGVAKQTQQQQQHHGSPSGSDARTPGQPRHLRGNAGTAPSLSASQDASAASAPPPPPEVVVACPNFPQYSGVYRLAASTAAPPPPPPPHPIPGGGAGGAQQQQQPFLTLPSLPSSPSRVGVGVSVSVSPPSPGRGGAARRGASRGSSSSTLGAVLAGGGGRGVMVVAAPQPTTSQAPQASLRWDSAPSRGGPGPDMCVTRSPDTQRWRVEDKSYVWLEAAAPPPSQETRGSTPHARPDLCLRWDARVWDPATGGHTWRFEPSLRISPIWRTPPDASTGGVDFLAPPPPAPPSGAGGAALPAAQPRPSQGKKTKNPAPRPEGLGLKGSSGGVGEKGAVGGATGGVVVPNLNRMKEGAVGRGGVGVLAEAIPAALKVFCAGHPEYSGVYTLRLGGGRGEAGAGRASTSSPPSPPRRCSSLSLASSARHSIAEGREMEQRGAEEGGGAVGQTSYPLPPIPPGLGVAPPHGARPKGVGGGGGAGAAPASVQQQQDYICPSGRSASWVCGENVVCFQRGFWRIHREAYVFLEMSEETRGASVPAGGSAAGGASATLRRTPISPPHHRGGRRQRRVEDGGRHHTHTHTHNPTPPHDTASHTAVKPGKPRGSGGAAAPPPGLTTAATSRGAKRLLPAGISMVEAAAGASAVPPHTRRGAAGGGAAGLLQLPPPPPAAAASSTSAPRGGLRGRTRHPRNLWEVWDGKKQAWARAHVHITHCDGVGGAAAVGGGTSPTKGSAAQKEEQAGAVSTTFITEVGGGGGGAGRRGHSPNASKGVQEKQSSSPTRGASSSPSAGSSSVSALASASVSSRDSSSSVAGAAVSTPKAADTEETREGLGDDEEDVGDADAEAEEEDEEEEEEEGEEEEAPVAKLFAQLPPIQLPNITVFDIISGAALAKSVDGTTSLGGAMSAEEPEDKAEAVREVEGLLFGFHSHMRMQEAQRVLGLTYRFTEMKSKLSPMPEDHGGFAKAYGTEKTTFNKRCMRELKRISNQRKNLYGKKRRVLNDILLPSAKAGSHNTRWRNASNCLQMRLFTDIEKEFKAKRRSLLQTWMDTLHAALPPVQTPCCRGVLEYLGSLFKAPDLVLNKASFMHLCGEVLSGRHFLLDDVVRLLWCVKRIFQVTDEQFCEIVRSRTRILFETSIAFPASDPLGGRPCPGAFPDTSPVDAAAGTAAAGGGVGGGPAPAVGPAGAVVGVGGVAAPGVAGQQLPPGVGPSAASSRRPSTGGSGG